MSLHFAAESGRLDDVKHFLTDDNVDSADEKGVSIYSTLHHTVAMHVPMITLGPRLHPYFGLCAVWPKLGRIPRSIPGSKAALKFDELTKFNTTFHVLVCV